MKAVFFDFDGVITTDKKGSTSSANYISANTTVSKQLFLEKYRAFGPDILTGRRTHADIWPELCLELGQNIEYRLLLESFISTPINQEMIDLIKLLKENGYLTGLITDNKTDRMEHLINHHQWQDLFDILAVSADVGSRKDSPAIFEYALAQADLKATESLFIDNTASNLIIPQEMGFVTLFYDDDKQDVGQLIAGLKHYSITL